jgi:hypothetical protein
MKSSACSGVENATGSFFRIAQSMRTGTSRSNSSHDFRPGLPRWPAKSIIWRHSTTTLGSKEYQQNLYAAVMGRFYFDFHDDTGIIRDDAGEELPSATAARKEALEVVGQAVKDLTHRHSDGRIVIEVRDGDGPIFRVSAVVETACSKSKAS